MNPVRRTRDQTDTMGCAGFTCSKHSLGALNILYVVRLPATLYHMVDVSMA